MEWITLKGTVSETAVLLHFDGGAQPNPGPAGAGSVLLKEGVVICKKGEFIEHATNNVAEYTGLINGLREALVKGFKEISIEGDSQLVIYHVTKKWKCRDAKLALLLKEVESCLSQFEAVRIRHVYRRFNSDADEVCDKAILLKQTFEEVFS